MDGKTLRDGIFSLRTRRFGTVAELLIKRLVNLQKGKNIFHDLYDDAAKLKIEVKFSAVLKSSDIVITEENVLQCIEDAIAANRMVNYSEWKDSKFDSNIQQVKRSQFDVLYYGLFFADKILVFRIKSEEIDKAGISYSDKQHKGNIGEGQFHINNDTLEIHLEKFLVKELSYEVFYSLLT